MIGHLLFRIKDESPGLATLVSRRVWVAHVAVDIGLRGGPEGFALRYPPIRVTSIVILIDIFQDRLLEPSLRIEFFY